MEIDRLAGVEQGDLGVEPGQPGGGHVAIDRPRGRRQGRADLVMGLGQTGHPRLAGQAEPILGGAKGHHFRPLAGGECGGGLVGQRTGGAELQLELGVKRKQRGRNGAC